MKILFAWIFKIIPLNGGVERVSYIVMDGLRSRGYQCDNIVCENDNHDFYLNNEVTDENHLSLEQLKTYLEEQQYDVIVCQDGNSISMAKVFKENAPLSTKLISCLHSDPTMWESVFSVNNVFTEIKRSSSLKKKLFWLIRLAIQPFWSKYALKGIANIYKINYQYSDKFVLLSKEFFTDMRRYMGIQTDEKLYAIPNPLSFEEIATPEILKKKKKEVLIVSRLDETSKKIGFALKVWEIVQNNGYNDWTLRIVGHGPDENYLKNIVKKNHIPNVTFEGRQMPIPFYETASIFMMTSDAEGWGMTLTESLQYGVVPIARNSYLSLHDIITDGDNGYIVNPKSPEEFANRIIYLIGTPKERETTALNGLESAKRYTKENVIMKWELLISSL